MPGIYDLIMGAPPDAQESARVMADQIRSGRYAQLLGALGSQDAIGAMGKAVGGQATQDTSMLERGVEARSSRDMKAQGLVAGLEKALAVQQARTEASNQRGMDMKEIAALRALAGANKERPTKPLPGKEMDTLKDLEETIRAALDIQKNFDPKYAGQPILGGLKNLAGRTLGGIAGQEAVAQNDFWAKFQMLVNLPKRHDFFGSALTPTEKASWQEAQNIGPTAPPELVKRKFDEMVMLAQKGLDYRVTARKAEGVYSGDAIDAIAPHASQGGGAAAPAGAVKSKSGKWIRKNAQGKWEYL